MLNFKLDMSVSLLCYEQKADYYPGGIYEYGFDWIDCCSVILDQ
jgi:hypothetical protein